MSSFQAHYNTVSSHYSFGKTLETFLPSKIYSREIDSSLGVHVAPSTLGGMCQTLAKTSILFYLILFFTIFYTTQRQHQHGLIVSAT